MISLGITSAKVIESQTPFVLCAYDLDEEGKCWFKTPEPAKREREEGELLVLRPVTGLPEEVRELTDDDGDCPVLDAVQASASLPFIMQPVTVGGSRCCDSCLLFGRVLEASAAECDTLVVISLGDRTFPPAAVSKKEERPDAPSLARYLSDSTSALNGLFDDYANGAMRRFLHRVEHDPSLRSKRVALWDVPCRASGAGGEACTPPCCLAPIASSRRTTRNSQASTAGCLSCSSTGWSACAAPRDCWAATVARPGKSLVAQPRRFGPCRSLRGP